jgi:hypothetical protein
LERVDNLKSRGRRLHIQKGGSNETTATRRTGAWLVLRDLNDLATRNRPYDLVVAGSTKARELFVHPGNYWTMLSGSSCGFNWYIDPRKHGIEPGRMLHGRLMMAERTGEDQRGPAFERV